MPTMEDIEAGIRFNEEMVKVGILKGADGITPSKFGKRLALRRHGKPSRRCRREWKKCTGPSNHCTLP
jgi:hypothetical protein